MRRTFVRILQILPAPGGKRAMGADIAGFGDPLADRDVPALFAADASGVDYVSTHDIILQTVFS